MDQYMYPCFPGVLLTSILHNILSKPLAAFPCNHCQNNGQRILSQSSERIFAELEGPWQKTYKICLVITSMCILL